MLFVYPLLYTCKLILRVVCSNRHIGQLLSVSLSLQVYGTNTCLFVCVEVLWPSQPMGSCRAWSVYLITLLLGRLSPLSS